MHAHPVIHRIRGAQAKFISQESGNQLDMALGLLVLVFNWPLDIPVRSPQHHVGGKCQKAEPNSYAGFWLKRQDRQPDDGQGAHKP
jgi:hypothetical protein